MELKNKKIIVLAVVILFVAFFVFLLVEYTNKKFISPTIAPAEVGQGTIIPKPFDANFSPTGKIYLSLSPVAKGNAQQLGIYVYDLKTGKLEKFMDETGQGINYFASQFSPQGDKLVFSAFLSEAAKENSLFTKIAQIYVSDKDGNNKKLLAADVASGSAMPTWSSDQKLVAFQTAKDISSEEKFIIPENWQIKVADLAGKETVITDGAYPKFLPDGKLIVLKSEGLYLFNTSGQDKGQLVWPMKEGSQANMGMKYSISNDGKHIAWLSAKAKKIHIGEVSFTSKDQLAKIKPMVDRIAKQYNEPANLNPLNFNKFESLDAQAYWPVFSADNKYLTWEEVDAKNENPKLVIYNLETQEKRDILDFKDYYQTNMYLNDWTK